ncbi:M48 family metalloprotease [Dysgonomonas sp. 520]|uniref:M48 family metalloprotease n=1 Tax=Dysgonomonas sp. 520 TaxID=2302931 RepID=UPI0013D33E5A|nr:M48 family metalloprotease [Dysgonomonas sp. 520]NDW10825.1 peptidase [Dysgonomonas sp. 520]
MKKIILTLGLILSFSLVANAQFGKIKIDKAVGAAVKGAQAFTLTDEQMAAYCAEYVVWFDKEYPICSTTDKDKGMRECAERLEKIVAQIPIKEVDGLKLDIRAGWVVNINAFACANGSIRVFAGLMDVMTDDEIMAIIGHEIGHIANKDSKNAFKTALLTSALKDAAGAAGGTAAQLSESQVGALGEALTNAQYSQKQETAADKYGFEFMKKCKKDPKNMASSLGVLLKIQQEAGAGGTDAVNKLFSTHPDLDKRIANLNKLK